MDQPSTYGRWYTPLFFFIVFAVYVLFPSQNNSIDSWGYAALVKHGEGLLMPHHLLYNAFMWALVKPFQLIYPAVSALKLMIFFNGVIASLSILLLNRILLLLNHSTWERLGLLGIAAFSFGFWRFATENETYILPIFFSLSASSLYIACVKSHRFYFAFFCGLSSSIALLFHQVHVFWWLGLFIGFFFIKEGWKGALLYLLPALIVPLAYIFALITVEGQEFTLNSLTQYILHDVYEGNAGFAPELRFLSIGAISLVRSFVQVHGVVWFILKSYPVMFGVGAIAAGLFLYAVVIKTISLFKKKWFITAKSVFLTHLVIFILQFGFAIYAVGNAEFMAMLPALLMIILACFQGWDKRFVMATVAGLFIWNFSFGILPLSAMKLAADDKIGAWAETNSDKYLVTSQYHLVGNQIFYLKGEEPTNLIKPPSYYLSRGEETTVLSNKIDSLLYSGAKVYTDCTGMPELLNRSSMLFGEGEKAFFEQYELSAVDSFQTSMGGHFLYKIRPSRQDANYSR